MPIRNPAAVDQSHWDWFPYAQYLGQRMEIGDVDGIFERGGHVFLIETKRPGQHVPTGQHILHECLVHRYCLTVFVVWGHPEKQEIETVRIRQPWVDDLEFETTFADFGKFIGAWYQWANDNRLPEGHRASQAQHEALRGSFAMVLRALGRNKGECVAPPEVQPPVPRVSPEELGRRAALFDTFQRS